MARRDLDRIKQWATIINDCNQRKHGTSIQAWCAQQGVHFNRYKYWQRKIQTLISDGDDEIIEIMRELESQLTGAGEYAIGTFVDITPQCEPVVTEKSVRAYPSSDIEVESELIIQTGAFRIYIGNNIHEATLQTVLKVVSNV